MAFYGERFENKESETIWDELKYWLQNPILAEEQAVRDKEIQNYIDAIMKKAFGS